MNKKIIIAAGGTGGHLLPAQALAAQLVKKSPQVEILFVGAGLTRNRFFNRDAFSFKTVASGSVPWRKPFKSLWSGIQIVRGIAEGSRIIREFKPDVIVGFGSFHTFPLLAAAKLAGIPVVIHEENSILGRVNKFFAGSAEITTVAFPAAAKKVIGRVIEVGLPLREGYSLIFSSREKAREHFALDPHIFTLLVFGGSQGALVINNLFCSAAMKLLERTKKFQVLHFTGGKAASETCRECYEALGITAVVKEFEPRMDQAWIASDLAITRAGASSVAEQLELEVPSILIPYPFATDRHQDKNADFVVQTVGGGVKLVQSETSSSNLVQAICDIVGQDQKRLKEMKQSIREYKQKNRRQDLCSVVFEVLGIKVR